MVCGKIVPEQAGSHHASRRAPARYAAGGDSRRLDPGPDKTARRHHGCRNTKIVGCCVKRRPGGFATHRGQALRDGDGYPTRRSRAPRKAADNADIGDAGARWLYELAWFEVYFHHDAGAAERWLAAIKQLVAADNVVLKRLEGWHDLAAGKNDAARAIFTAQQIRISSPELGLFQLELAEKHDKQVEAVGQKLLSEPRQGIWPRLFTMQRAAGRSRPRRNPPPPAQCSPSFRNFPASGST